MLIVIPKAFTKKIDLKKKNKEKTREFEWGIYLTQKTV